MAQTISAKTLKSMDPSRVLNLNVGVLGHVDSGKTSLVKTLSTLLSTASLDKSSQSRQRGITLDLGFSAFLMPLPPSIAKDPVHSNVFDLLQVTLVDAPGHASLIRTIIGGAQIIDMVLLVVDATKGIQTQTAECLVIAEMTTKNLIIVLNKADLFPESEREERLKAVERDIRHAFRNSRFRDAPMVGVSACVGGEKVAAMTTDATIPNTGEKDGTGHVSANAEKAETMNVNGLLDLLKAKIEPPDRSALKSSFHFSIDHCFPIKGQGTVITGTCLAGSLKPGDMIEFPSISYQRKVKSMQMFRRKVELIRQGDRAGICIANLDPKLMERGVAAKPGSVKLMKGAIAVVKKVRYFRGTLVSGGKFHVSVGHTTVMATVTFWGAKELYKKLHGHKMIDRIAKLDVNDGEVELNSSSLGNSAELAGLPQLEFDFDEDFLQQDIYAESLSSDMNQMDTKSTHGNPLHWAMLEFQTPIYCPLNSLIIGSRLDTDILANTCRLAFSGRLVHKLEADDNTRIKFYNLKERSGVVCRLGDPFRRNDDGKVVRYDVYGTDLFKKETNMNQFVGLQLVTERGDVGLIQSAFGSSGKFKVGFPAGTDVRNGDKLFLKFKRYVHDSEKKICQDLNLPLPRIGTRIEPQGKKGKKDKNNGASVDSSKADAIMGIIASMKGEAKDNGHYTIVIVEGFFTPEINVREKVGLKVRVVNSDYEGTIMGPFGKAGKCKVSFEDGIPSMVGGKVELVEDVIS